MPSRVTVVIPNWNGRSFLKTCLSSLRDQSFKDFQTILVDNGSTDDSTAFVERNFPEVEVLKLPENSGFSVAVNAGILASDTDYVALLNNDTEQERDWLSELIHAADNHPESGFFASKLIDFRSRRVLDGAGDTIRRSGLPYRLGHGEVDRGQYEKPRQVFGACAAAAMYRREMLEKVGLFDEDFFAYCEDGDISFRAQLAGYRCLYVPGAVVYHMGSASTGGKRSEFATRLGTRNGINLLVKNLPTPLIPRFALFFAVGQVSRMLVTVASGVWKAHLLGLAEAIRMLPSMLQKRREIQKSRRVPNNYILRLLRESSRMALMSQARRVRDKLLVRLEK